jgi:hypothetical protein
MPKIVNNISLQTQDQSIERVARDMYLVDLNVRKDNSIGYEYIKFQSVPPELAFESNSSFVPIATVGRNNPFYHYTGSEDILNFTLDWYANDTLRLGVIQSCKWLEALTKADGYLEEPHIVKLIWGDLFEDSTWIVTKASYRLTQFQAIGMRPVQAYQDVELRRVIGHNRLRSEILDPFV